MNEMNMKKQLLITIFTVFIYMTSCEQAKLSYDVSKKDKNSLEYFNAHWKATTVHHSINENLSEHFDSHICVGAYHTESNSNDQMMKYHFCKWLFMIVYSGEIVNKKLYITNLAYLTNAYKIPGDNIHIHLTVFIKDVNDRNNFIIDILQRVKYPHHYNVYHTGLNQRNLKINNFDYSISSVENESTHEGIHSNRIMGPLEEQKIREYCKKEKISLIEIGPKIKS